MASTIFLGVTPIPLGIEVAQDKLFLQTELDPGRGPSDFASDESLAPPGRLVVEKNSAARMQAVGFRNLRSTNGRKPWRTHKGNGARRAWSRLEALPEPCHTFPRKKPDNIEPSQPSRPREPLPGYVWRLVRLRCPYIPECQKIREHGFGRPNYKSRPVANHTATLPIGLHLPDLRNANTSWCHPPMDPCKDDPNDRY